MKKSRLASDHPYRFELIGLVSSVKEYTLAWHLNQMNSFHLVKGDDIKIEFSNNQVVRVSVLLDESEFRQVYLLRNKLVASNHSANHFLLSELQQFDYLLKISSQTEENWSNRLLLKLKELDVIDYSVIIDIGKVKMKDNLMF